MAKKRVKAGTSKTKAAERRTKFIEEYIKNGGNATQAYKAAGFHPSTDAVARVEGSRILAEPNIAAALSGRAKKVAAITGLDTERTAREIARLAYSDPRKFYDDTGNLIPVHRLDDDAAACIASLEVDEINVGENVVGNTKKIKVWDKNAALEKAAKIHGLYKEDNKQKGESLALRVLFGDD